MVDWSFSDVDRDILQKLREDASIKPAKLARQINMSNTACRNRIKHLRKNGYINNYTITIGSKNTNFKEFGYMFIRLKHNNESDVKEICSFLCSIRNTVMLELLTGSLDILLKIGFDGLAEFNSILNMIRSHRLEVHTEASICLKVVREHHIDINQLI